MQVIRRRALVAALGAAFAAMGPGMEASVAAGPAVQASPVVVTATREEKPNFEVPASVDVIDKETIQEGSLGVNISEVIGRVPGVNSQFRQSYAQDIQVSSRGFGARSQFGLRGIRVIIDDVPGTNSDGQGSLGAAALSSVERIEVLRGPFSALYGNHSGGVIQVFTEAAPERPELSGNAAYGSDNTVRAGAKFGGRSGPLDLVVDAYHFETDGYRDHSEAERDHFNARLRWQLGDATRLTFVANGMDQPESQDPLGLNAAQVAADRRQAGGDFTPGGANSISFNTRRSLSNNQGGMVLDHAFSDTTRLKVVGYFGNRQNEQYLAIPLATQAAATSGGGVAVIDRDFGGLSFRVSHDAKVADRPFKLTAGFDWDRMEDARTGYINNLGVKTTLKRDEVNIATSTGVYAQAEWALAERWSVSGGVRHTTVKFKSEDHFIAAGNVDDSGSVSHTDTTPVLGLLFRAADNVNVYVNAGKGFETPTLTELSYTLANAGFNTGLKPMKSYNVEAGVKALLGDSTQVNAAIFRVNTKDEIVVLESRGGRTVYQNAGHTRREGFELSVDSRLPGNFKAFASLGFVDARYTDDFLTCGAGAFCNFTTGASVVTVPSGNRIPGIPETSLYGELSWKHPASGFNTGIELSYASKIATSDVNDEFSGSYAVVNWRGGFEQKVGGWRFAEFLRVDNLGDEKYNSAVLINDGNRRYYAPAPERTFLLGLNAKYTF